MNGSRGHGGESKEAEELQCARRGRSGIGWSQGAWWWRAASSVTQRVSHSASQLRRLPAPNCAVAPALPSHHSTYPPGPSVALPNEEYEEANHNRNSLYAKGCVFLTRFVAFDIQHFAPHKKCTSID